MNICSFHYLFQSIRTRPYCLHAPGWHDGGDSMRPTMTETGSAVAYHGRSRFPQYDWCLSLPCPDAFPPAPTRSLSWCALALCLALPGGIWAATAHAAGTASYPAPLTDARSTAHAWGVETRITSAVPCRVAFGINQTTFMAHVPEMVRAGLFSTQVTPALRQAAPHYLMNAVQTDVTPGFVHALFTQRGAPARCHFTWSYTAPDGRSHPMLDFDFTRQAHDRIDWTHMELGAMTSDMQNPVVDPIFDALVNQETVDVTIALAHGPDPADLPPPDQKPGMMP